MGVRISSPAVQATRMMRRESSRVSVFALLSHDLQQQQNKKKRATHPTATPDNNTHKRTNTRCQPRTDIFHQHVPGLDLFVNKHAPLVNKRAVNTQSRAIAADWVQTNGREKTKQNKTKQNKTKKNYDPQTQQKKTAVSTRTQCGGTTATTM
jgi:hypothetical protein